MPGLLDEMGVRLKTDKASTHHNYLVHYERIMSPLREEQFDLLEIGILNGSSIRLWHEYFSAASIIGVDIKPISIDGEMARFQFERGSQADPKFLHDLAHRFQFRIVIDDGSHLWGHQIFTFQTLFPLLDENCIYICEDLQTSFGSYVDRYSGGAEESAATYFSRLSLMLTAGKADPVSRTKDPLAYAIISKIQSVTFLRHAVIIQS